MTAKKRGQRRDRLESSSHTDSRSVSKIKITVEHILGLKCGFI